MIDKTRKDRAKRLKEYRQKYGCTLVNGAHFGDLCIYGEKHAEAAKWLKKAITGSTMGGEIKAHAECQDLFDVVVCQIELGE